MKKIKNEKGFTIIELFIVMALIMILTAIGVNSFITWHEIHESKRTETQLIIQSEEKKEMGEEKAEEVKSPKGDFKKL